MDRCPCGAFVYQEHTQQPDSKMSCSETEAASVESRFHGLLGHHVPDHRCAGVSRMTPGEILEIGKPRSSQGSSAVCVSQLSFVSFFCAPHFPCPQYLNPSSHRSTLCFPKASLESIYKYRQSLTLVPGLLHLLTVFQVCLCCHRWQHLLL